ncbi:MAG: N(5)-(carboxyethyl)ornithine synthase [Candidatus Cloacimonetes bacterium]|nr:N(5)-(carboxyethyl)ornithine synthase [Candidatus Cloacimonadota bacterium]
MKIGFIKPQSKCERRVVLLPQDIGGINDELYFEQDFGANMEIDDNEYIRRGARIRSREEIFTTCDAIFNLKPVEESDYPLIRKHQTFLGWLQPLTTGREFYETIFLEKELSIIDTDIITTFYHKDKITPVQWVKKYFTWDNSVLAGYASLYHATLTHGLMIHPQTRIAVLGTGNVAQGAFQFATQLGARVRMFYRQTMDDFKKTLDLWDIIVSGIRLDDTVEHILNEEEQMQLKKGCLVIDATGDAGRTFEGTHFSELCDPIYEYEGKFYYVVNNTPSLFYRSASEILSQSFRLHIFNHRLQDFLNLL